MSKQLRSQRYVHADRLGVVRRRRSDDLVAVADALEADAVDLVAAADALEADAVAVLAGAELVAELDPDSPPVFTQFAATPIPSWLAFSSCCRAVVSASAVVASGTPAILSRELMDIVTLDTSELGIATSTRAPLAMAPVSIVSDIIAPMIPSCTFRTSDEFTVACTAAIEFIAAARLSDMSDRCIIQSVASYSVRRFDEAMRGFVMLDKRRGAAEMGANAWAAARTTVRKLKENIVCVGIICVLVGRNNRVKMRCVRSRKDWRARSTQTTTPGRKKRGGRERK